MQSFFDILFEFFDSFLLFFYNSLDPNNRKAVNQLMALNEISTNANGSGGSSLFEVISSARESNELNGNSNFEMLESTQMTPPNEMLPPLEEEDTEINVW